MIKTKRIEELDILKALGIICMVLGHADAPGTHFIYLFHMAIFFMASGFLFKENVSDDHTAVMTGIKAKVKHLWLPFFICNAIYVLLHNTFIRLNIYTNNSEIFNYVTGPYIRTAAYYTFTDALKNILSGVVLKSREQMFGTNWFIRVLFMVSVLYLICDYLLKRLFKSRILRAQLAVSAVFLFLGFYCRRQNIDARGLAQTASFYCLYYIGHLLRIYKYRYDSLSGHQYALLLVLSFGILFVLNGIGSVGLGDNTYPDPVFLLAASIGGWFFLYSMARLMMMNQYIKRIMSVIGKHTMSVVFLHFLAFKPIHLIVISVYNLPAFCIATFPNLFGSRGLWWLVYTAAGVTVPVILGEIYSACKQSILQKRKTSNYLE